MCTLDKQDQFFTDISIWWQHKKIDIVEERVTEENSAKINHILISDYIQP